MSRFEVIPSQGQASVFLCYRRGDCSHFVGRLGDSLAQFLGPKRVFVDDDSVAPGADFVEEIQKAISACDVLLAIVGPRWARTVDAARHRESSVVDYVMLEIVTALKVGVPVVPILVDGADMPAIEDLPSELETFPRRNAVQMHAASYRQDLERLLQHLVTLLGASQPGGRLLARAIRPRWSGIAWRIPGVVFLLAALMTLITLIALLVQGDPVYAMDPSGAVPIVVMAMAGLISALLYHTAYPETTYLFFERCIVVEVGRHWRRQRTIWLHDIKRIKLRDPWPRLPWNPAVIVVKTPPSMRNKRMAMSRREASRILRLLEDAVHRERVGPYGVLP